MNLLEGFFEKGLKILGKSKEELRARSEFNFDKYNPQNFESARAVLRIAIALSQNGFTNIRLIDGDGLADLRAEGGGETWFIEVKTLILQLKVEEFDFEGKKFRLEVDKFQPESSNVAEYVDTFSRWVADRVQKGRSQLQATKAKLGPGKTMIAVVANWFNADYFLDEESVRGAWARLQGAFEGWEKNYLDGIDAFAVLTGELRVVY